MKMIALFIGFSQGMAVAAAVEVLLAILGIVPQLATVTGTRKQIQIYGYSLCAGIAFFASMHLFEWRLASGWLGIGLLAFCMLLWGVFTGVLLCALAEAFDIIPAFTSKLNLGRLVKWFIIVLALGKMAGSAVYWLTPFFQ